MSNTLQIIIAVLTLISAIGGFLFWHFTVINSFKDQVRDLKLELKDLEKRDDLQQQTIDQLKELYPLFKQIFDSLHTKAKR